MQRTRPMTYLDYEFDNGIHYPSSDGKPMGESSLHMFALVDILSALLARYETRPEVFVGGDLFWYYERDRPAERVAPDVLVAIGVEPKPDVERPSFLAWKEKVGPCFVLEILSQKSSDIDLHDKYQLYQRLRVAEYFLLDPKGDFMEARLAGYRCRAGQYHPIKLDAHDRLTSRKLGLTFSFDAGKFILADAATGQVLLSPSAANRVADEKIREARRATRRATSMARLFAQERAAKEQERAAKEQERAAKEQEQAAREREQAAAARQIADLQAEVERLRRQRPG